MLNASEFYGPRINRGSRGNSTLLKGSMVPKRVKEFSICVERIRLAPADWDCKLILDFTFPIQSSRLLRGSPAARASSWAVNKTNGIKLRTYLSDADDFEEIAGARIRLRVLPQRDPKSGERVPSLEISAFEGEAVELF